MSLVPDAGTVAVFTGIIAAAFNDFQGRPATLLLTTDGGEPLPKETFLHHVAQPFQLDGVVRKSGDELFFEVEPSSISGAR